MMTDREWLIWYRNWLCHEHNVDVVMSARKVVDAIDEQLGVAGARKADDVLAAVGRPCKASAFDHRVVKGMPQSPYKKGGPQPSEPPQWFKDSYLQVLQDMEMPHKQATEQDINPPTAPIGQTDPGHLFYQPTEAFWRCEHMPSAIDNYFSHNVCTHGCHRAELRWYDNGTCKPPTS